MRPRSSSIAAEIYLSRLSETSGCAERLQLAPQRLDLVTQLGCVLEAQIVGGEKHLLLQLHDRLLDLLRRHSLFALASMTALAGPRHLRVERQEVGHVG